MNKHLPSYFEDFLAAIRPTVEEIADYKDGHETLRARLTADTVLGPIIITTFLQGSYRRATAIRPEGGKRSDVDVVVVTRLSENEHTPQAALDKFKTFLDTHYKGQWEMHGRSIGIELDEIELDLVVTSAPAESEEGILKSASVSTSESLEEAQDWRLDRRWQPAESRREGSTWLTREVADEVWRTEPLRIPDRDAACWQDTHPLEQIRWTQEKNGNCNRHYINVIKALKWWRRVMHPTPKYPKGYPVEHLIGACCPDGVESVAEGIVLTLETIVRTYKLHAAAKIVPELPDHGVPSHNVFKRITGEEFAAFYDQVAAAAIVARAAFEEDEDVAAKVTLWQNLFGDAFPDPPKGDDRERSGGFTKRTSATTIGSGRFA